MGQERWNGGEKVIKVGGKNKYMRRLKNLKEKAKSWDEEAFGNMCLRKAGILEEMKVLDKLVAETTIS